MDMYRKVEQFDLTSADIGGKFKALMLCPINGSAACTLGFIDFEGNTGATLQMNQLGEAPMTIIPMQGSNIIGTARGSSVLNLKLYKLN